MRKERAVQALLLMELLELLLSCSYESTPHSHPLIHRHKYMMSCFGLITQNPFLSLIPPQDQQKRRRRRTDGRNTRCSAFDIHPSIPFQDDPSKTFIPRYKEAESLTRTSARICSEVLYWMVAPSSVLGKILWNLK